MCLEYEPLHGSANKQVYCPCIWSTGHQEHAQCIGESKRWPEMQLLVRYFCGQITIALYVVHTIPLFPGRPCACRTRSVPLRPYLFMFFALAALFIGPHILYYDVVCCHVFFFSFHMTRMKGCSGCIAVSCLQLSTTAKSQKVKSYRRFS